MPHSAVPAARSMSKMLQSPMRRMPFLSCMSKLTLSGEALATVRSYQSYSFSMVTQAPESTSPALASGSQIHLQYVGTFSRSGGVRTTVGP